MNDAALTRPTGTGHHDVIASVTTHMERAWWERACWERACWERACWERAWWAPACSGAVR